MADRVGGGSPHVSREQIEAAEASFAEFKSIPRALSAAATARPDPDWLSGLQEAVKCLREAVAMDAPGYNPGTILSPDGWCQIGAAADDARYVLERLEPILKAFGLRGEAESHSCEVCELATQLADERLLCQKWEATARSLREALEESEIASLHPNHAEAFDRRESAFSAFERVSGESPVSERDFHITEDGTLIETSLGDDQDFMIVVGPPITDGEPGICSDCRCEITSETCFALAGVGAICDDCWVVRYPGESQ